MTRLIQKLCVFCGSNKGFDPSYVDTARQIGRDLAKNKIELVYGGGNVGLMGAVADGCMESGGTVHGIIPKFLLDREVGHLGISHLHVVDTMHERKRMMAELSDGFIALPGGYGTLEEIFEVITWAQIGVHTKPCGFLNIGGFYDPLFTFLRQTAERGFIRAAHLDIALFESKFDLMLEKMKHHKLPDTSKWLADKI